MLTAWLGAVVTSITLGGATSIATNNCQQVQNHYSKVTASSKIQKRHKNLDKVTTYKDKKVF